MEIDYIIDSLMALIAISGCMMACSIVGWIVEELLPMIFPGLGKMLDKLMGLYDDDV